MHRKILNFPRVSELKIAHRGAGFYTRQFPIKDDIIAVLLAIPVSLISLGAISIYNAPRSASYAVASRAAHTCYRNNSTSFYFYSEGNGLYLWAYDPDGLRAVRVFDKYGMAVFREEYEEGDVFPTLVDRLMPVPLKENVHLEFIDGKSMPTLSFFFPIPRPQINSPPAVEQIQFIEPCRAYYPLTT